MSDGEKISKSINLILNLMKEKDSRTTDEIRSFISEVCIPYSKEKKDIYVQHDIDNTNKFNFFESISDRWYRENFHSDIFFTILNPKTPEIYRKFYLEEFVKFVGISQEQFDCKAEYEIIKEAPTGIITWIDNKNQKREKEGYIDLLITNVKKQAIIIENKINYAPDMENQLVRYMKYVHRNLEIDDYNYTVVYLTLINDNKKPPINSYDEDFEKYTRLLRNEIKKVLYEEYAVDSKKSLAKDFLPACINRIKSEMCQNPDTKEVCNVASMYLNQYKILLEHLGGYAYMDSTDKKIIEEIYSNKEALEAADDFFNLWNRKEEIILEILREYFSEKYHWKLNEDEIYSKKLNEEIELFYQLHKNNHVQIGYGIGNIDSLKKKKLEETIKKVKFQKFTLLNEGDCPIVEKDWIYIELYSDNLYILKDYFKNLSECLDELIELTKKAGYEFE